MHARKWVACLNQLGLARAWKDEKKGPIEITKVGDEIIADAITFEEAMLRQLLKYQIPSIIENGKDFDDFNVHPFRVFLEILYLLHEKNIVGLTKEEIGLYVITTLKNKDITSSVKTVINYRNERKLIKGNNPKLEYFKKRRKELLRRSFSTELDQAQTILKEIYSHAGRSKGYIKSKEYVNQLRPILFGKEPKKQMITRGISDLLKGEVGFNELFDFYLDAFIGTKGGTLKDYADSQARYAMTSGLFSLNRDRIVIKNNKLDLVKSIVEQKPIFVDEKRYLEYLYDPEQPKLPLDDENFMFVNVGELQNEIEKLSRQTGIKSEFRMIKDFSVPKLKKVSQELEAELIKQKEYLFYRAQAQNEQIDDIVEHFSMIEARTLLGGEAYYPAYYEWTIWRVFLAINTIIGSVSETRNFVIDEELIPIHHAKGGVPDMVFNYENFTLVCEATLHQSVSQWSAEYTSVPKHVGTISAQSKKPVFGLFVAPRIEPNMAQQLFKADWHVDDRYIDLNIIPLSTVELIELLKIFQKTHFSVEKLRNIFEKFVIMKKEVANGKEWYEKIKNKLLTIAN